MGEVRVTIKLANSVDRVLARQGKLPIENVRSLEIEGVVDTGSVSLTLPSHIVEQLGLTREFKQVAHPNQPVLKIRRRIH